MNFLISQPETIRGASKERPATPTTPGTTINTVAMMNTDTNHILNSTLNEEGCNIHDPMTNLSIEPSFTMYNDDLNSTTSTCNTELGHVSMWSSSHDAEEEIIYITYDDNKNILLIIPHSIQLTNYRIQSNIKGMRMIAREENENATVTTHMRPSRSITPVRNTPSVLKNAF